LPTRPATNINGTSSVANIHFIHLAACESAHRCKRRKKWLPDSPIRKQLRQATYPKLANSNSFQHHDVIAVNER
jgi:hypothetical protein